MMLTKNDNTTKSMITLKQYMDDQEKKHNNNNNVVVRKSKSSSNISIISNTKTNNMNMMKHNNKERNAAASPDYEYGMQNDDEDDSNNAAPLPWLLEVNSNYTSLPKRGQKKRGPKIKRVFPWTIETQHDANVLKQQQNIFEGIDTENILNTLPRLNGIEMFRPDSPKLLMKSTVEKYKQLMLQEDAAVDDDDDDKEVAVRNNYGDDDDGKFDEENEKKKKKNALLSQDVVNRNTTNIIHDDLSKMKHELKSLKRSLRVKSSLTSTNSNSNNMTNMKNVNYSIVGKSKTLERIGYHMNNNKKKQQKKENNSRKRRHLRAKSLPKLNRKLLPSSFNKKKKNQ